VNGDIPGVYGTLGTPAPGNFPGGRYLPATWTDSGGNLWLFGGEGYDAKGNCFFLNDLWEFNPSTNEWAWMGGSNTIGATGVYGTLGTPAAGNFPGGRVDAASWTDSSGNFWLFGGQGYDADGNYGFPNDLWEFNPSTNEWAWMGGSSTLAYDEYGQPGVYGTLGEYAAGNVPGGRWGGSGWTDSSGHLWLFGGQGAYYEDSGFNDLWEFNPSTNEWAWMGGSDTGQPGVYGTLGTPAAGNFPGSRSQAVSWTDSSGSFWLFGGSGVEASGTQWGYLNDLWEFNPSTNEWAWMGGSNTVPPCQDCGQPGVYGTLGTPAAGNVPGTRAGAVSWTDSNGNFWLFGGEGVDASGALGPLNDLWEYQPSTASLSATAVLRARQ
jgi:N-acetylneuraminic acid mutarotase